MNKLLKNKPSSTTNNFKIEVMGKLNKSLSDVLGGALISHQTINNKIISHLEGKIIDQSELIGILNTLYNMRFEIISVKVNDEKVA